MFPLLIFVFCTSLILFASYRFIRAFLPCDSICDYASSLFLAVFILIHLIIIAAGSIGHLTPLSVTITCILVSIVSIAVIKPSPKEHCSKQPQPSKPMIALLTFALTCYAVSAVILTGQSVVYPSLYYDALYFYLPSAVHWIQSASLEAWTEAPPEVRYFPGGSYLIYAWQLLLIGNDSLTGFIQPIIMLGSTITLIAIGNLLRFPRIPWAICCTAFFLSPLFPLFIVEDNNDFITIYTFLAALYFLIRYYQTPTPLIIFLGGCSAGLCLGSKYAGLCWIILCAILYVLLSLSIRCPLRQRITHIALWITGIFLLGGYWYIRNALETGNPFFPSLISLLGIPLYTVPDHMRALVYSDALNDFRAYVSSFALLHHPYRLNDVREFTQYIGLNYFLMGIVPFASVIILVRNARRCLHNLKSGHMPTIFMLISAVSGVLILTMPGLALYLQNLRYILPALALLLITAGFLLKTVSGQGAGTALAILHILISVTAIKNIPSAAILIVSITTAFASLPVMVYGKPLFRRISTIQWKRVTAPAIISCIITCIPLLLYTKSITDKHRYNAESGKHSNDEILRQFWKPLANGWQWLDNHADGAVIGFCDRAYVYPLFNSRLSNRLVNLDVSSRETLYAALHNRNIDYIFFQEQFIYDQQEHRRVRAGVFSEERKWLEEIPVQSVIVFENNGVAIYHILNENNETDKHDTKSPGNTF
ncbi:MAG: hypothetical protein C4541_07900 [Candidatus Auribacter fodinae]|uniref:Glycosyltransferase RgtA/B/C/D-like domain-containing protein n=1 Tax=Candidatus Auribacter fodinae TaxID=2093366 RepID=A0A3A4R0F6_9BACT|nr:MAG: hypothetical protein C4541_07900 [Candidatus Auribacter fodinae]